MDIYDITIHPLPPYFICAQSIEANENGSYA